MKFPRNLRGRAPGGSVRYGQSMRTEPKMVALYGAYVRAFAAHEDAMRFILDAQDAELSQTTLRRAESRLVIFYSLVYVLIEGMRECGVSDDRLEELLVSPNFVKLRRLRNSTFFFPPGATPADRHQEFLGTGEGATWMIDVWRELNRWFADNVRSATSVPAMQ